MTNVVVAEFLAEINQRGKLERTDINANNLASQIVIALGGLDKVITLCLTHCQNAISSLREEMTKIAIYENINQNSNQLEEQTVQQDSPSIHQIPKQISDHDKKLKKDDDMMIALNQKQFDAKFVVLRPNIETIFVING